MTQYTEAEQVSYFVRYLLEEQDNPVSVDTVKQRAAEENIRIPPSVIDSELLNNSGGMYTTDQNNGTITVTSVTPRGDCPDAIQALYATLDDVSADDVRDDEADADPSNALNINSEVGDLNAVSDAKAAELRDSGYETLADVTSATVSELGTVQSIPLPEARKIKKEAELASDPPNQIAREALAADLGLDVTRYGAPDIETLVKNARDATPSADIIDIDKVKQEPGTPIRFSEDWDGDDWHFNNLPILEDVGHPLVPDMEDAIAPRDVTLPTGETVTEAVCNTIARGEKGLLLEGPHGCGKNYLIQWAMCKTNRPVVEIDLNESMLAEHLIGSMMPQEDGSVAFNEKLIPYCAKNGISIVFNELRAAPPDVTMAIHDLLACGEIVLEESGEKIDVHPQFRFIATTNPNTVEYDGAGSLNAAFLDRLRIIPTDYLPRNKEINLLDDRFNRHRQTVSRNVVQSFVAAANETRDNRSVPTLSTRALEDAILWADENGNPRGTLKTMIEGLADRRSKTESIEQFIDDKVPEDVTN